MSVDLVLPPSQLILCCPLLLLPSVFPSMRALSNELAFCIKRPKYWSFSNSPFSQYLGLISFRIDWFDLLAVQGTHKSLRQHHNLKASIIAAMINLLYSETLISDAVFSVCNISFVSFSYLPILSPLCLCFSLNP